MPASVLPSDLPVESNTLLCERACSVPTVLRLMKSFVVSVSETFTWAWSGAATSTASARIHAMRFMLFLLFMPAWSARGDFAATFVRVVRGTRRERQGSYPAGWERRVIISKHMPFHCVRCNREIDRAFKACPHCGEPVTDFLREYAD